MPGKQLKSEITNKALADEIRQKMLSEILPNATASGQQGSPLKVATSLSTKKCKSQSHSPVSSGVPVSPVVPVVPVNQTSGSSQSIKVEKHNKNIAPIITVASKKSSSQSSSSTQPKKILTHFDRFSVKSRSSSLSDALSVSSPNISKRIIPISTSKVNGNSTTLIPTVKNDENTSKGGGATKMKIKGQVNGQLGPAHGSHNQTIQPITFPQISNWDQIKDPLHEKALKENLNLEKMNETIDGNLAKINRLKKEKLDRDMEKDRMK